jgi:hypothetical protein
VANVFRRFRVHISFPACVLRVTTRNLDSIRLSSWHQGWVYSATALLVISGIVWLVLHYFLVTPGEFGEGVHPMEHLTLSVHGGVAMAALIVYGSLLPIHIRRAWAIRRNIFLGIAVVVFMLALAITGYLLYYAGGEEARPIIGAVHWILGLAVPAVLAWHVLSGRAKARNG